jgi:hypothetical protein
MQPGKGGLSSARPGRVTHQDEADALNEQKVDESDSPKEQGPDKGVRGGERHEQGDEYRRGAARWNRGEERLDARRWVLRREHRIRQGLRKLTLHFENFSIPAARC